MAIEQNYMSKIEEIEGAENLSDFEKKFIFGDDQGRPMKERDSLSDKQKAMVDRIYKERVQEMSREDAAAINFGNPRVTAVQTEGAKSYRVAIDNVQIGPVVNFSEAINVVSWVSAVLTDGDVMIAVLEVVASAEETPNESAGFPGE